MTEEKKTIPKKVAPPKRKKRIEIDRNEMIPCRSAVHGSLIYIAPRTNARYLWEEFGSTLYLEMGELQDMNGSQRKYLQDGYIVVDDVEAAEFLNLTKIYEQLADLDDLNVLFGKSASKLEELLPKLPDGMRSTLAAKARELIDEGQLDSLNKIRAIEKALGVDLESFATRG